MPIFDQGYQHWSGELSGHAWRWLAITRHGVRLGMRNAFLRIMLLLAWLPAVALSFMLCLWGLLEQKSELIAPLRGMLTFLGPEILEDPRAYRIEIWTLCYDYFLVTELRFSMILVLILGPSLISQDLRFNALPLYFSRPLRRIDYFVGKLGVIGFFLGMVLILPSLIAYFLGLLFSLDLTILRDTLPLLLSSVGYGVVMILSIGLLILALSSLSRNSRYVALFWVGIWFVSSVTATIIDGVTHQHRRLSHYRRLAEVQANSKPRAGESPREQMKHQQEWQEAHLKLREEFNAEEIRSAKANWRPLISYTANLSRVGQQLLGTDACWERFSQKYPPGMREEFMLNNMGPQYPWYWSAGVLTFLLGLSAWILNFRVKSLDRLR